MELDRTLNLVGAEASGTSVHMARSPVDDSLDPLHIGLPSTIGTSVGMRNLDTKGHALTTKITLRHSLHLPSENQSNSAVHRRFDMIPNFLKKSKCFFTNFFVF